MTKDFNTIIEESINLELNIGNLYAVFYASFADDSQFWWRLVLEEKNHAALFRSGFENLEHLKKFPHDLLIKNIKILQEENKKLQDLVTQYKSLPPDREEAFNLALNLENTAAELHFQQFMDNDGDSLIDNIFRELNQADKDHAARILKYMKEHDIPLHEENKL